MYISHNIVKVEINLGGQGMCKRAYSLDSIMGENLPFFMFNLVMNKKEKFTYEELIDETKQVLNINIYKIEQLEPTIKKTLKDLREDGYIREKGSYYLVV